MGMKSATTGVLLMTLLSTPVASMSLVCATGSDVGLPSTQREIHAIAPVSRSPATTTYSAAIVSTPGLANPCSAWSGVSTPSRTISTIAPTSMTSVSKRVVVNSRRTPATTSRVMTISKVMPQPLSRRQRCARSMGSCAVLSRQGFATANRKVAKAEATYEGWIVQIASIEDRRRPQRVADTIEVRTAELLPFGEDGERVGASERLFGAVGKHEISALPVDAPGLGHRDWIVGTHGRAGRPQGVHQRAARRLAHVVGIGLEREPPERKRSAGELALKVAVDLVEQHALLTHIHGLDRGEQACVEAALARAVHQRLDVFRKAGTAVACSRVYEAVADARIRTDAEPDLLDVGADALGDVRHLVHEADLGGKHRVCRVLRQLRRAHVHHDHAVTVAGERLVERAQQLRRARVVGSDHDPVRLHEIRHGRAFLEELRVRDHVELEVHAALTQRALDASVHLVRSADRHGRLVDNDPELRHVPADGLGDREHVRQVRRTVLLRRRADGDELEEAVADPGHGVGRELEPALVEAATDELLEPGFVDRDLTLLQTCDLRRVDIDAQDLVAHVGKAGAGHQPDVTRTKYGNFQI